MTYDEIQKIAVSNVFHANGYLNEPFLATAATWCCQTSKRKRAICSPDAFDAVMRTLSRWDPAINVDGRPLKEQHALISSVPGVVGLKSWLIDVDIVRDDSVPRGCIGIEDLTGSTNERDYLVIIGIDGD